MLPGTEASWVPAGLLDDDPGLGIAGHIHVASKARWDEIPPGTPQFAEGPSPGPRGADRA